MRFFIFICSLYCAFTLLCIPFVLHIFWSQCKIKRMNVFYIIISWLNISRIGHLCMTPKGGIIIKTLRPDTVLCSKKIKKIDINELTVSWEERCTQDNERKRVKYEELVRQCREERWQARNYPIEVGCRGFQAPSLEDGSGYGRRRWTEEGSCETDLTGYRKKLQLAVVTKKCQ